MVHLKIAFLKESRYESMHTYILHHVGAFLYRHTRQDAICCTFAVKYCSGLCKSYIGF